MLGLKFYMAQRLSAMVMGPLVLGHLAVMIYAIQGGLSSAEILARTKGSIPWFLFYGGFVLTAAVHAAIGLRVIVHEMTGLKGWALAAFNWGVLILLTVMGARAVLAVTLL